MLIRLNMSCYERKEEQRIWQRNGAAYTGPHARTSQFLFAVDVNYTRLVQKGKRSAVLP